MEEYDIDPEVLAGFIDETVENLQAAEQMFIHLEANPDDIETVNSIFRPIHSLKGTSGFFGLIKTKELAHSMENLLDAVRKGEKKATKEIINALLPGIDQLNLIFENVRSGSAFIPMSTRGIITPDTLHLKDYGINSLTKDALVIKNIYYEYGKYRLKKEQKDILDVAVVALMQEAPEIRVELGSHTDDMGGEAFNLRLSQKRADEIVNYVIKQGIDKDRLVGKGYGYTVPVAPNKFDDGTDNPDGRAMNRRTEFKVIGTISEFDDFIED